MRAVEPVHLVDGRLLEVQLSGPAGGMPLVYHHGTPGAATPIRRVERAVHERGLRLLTISRPGYGASDRLAGRRVVDVCQDVSAVLDELGVEQCLVAGWSGGGPHALACAARLKQAIGAVAIASVAPAEAAGLDWLEGMGESNVAEFNASRAGEASLRGYLEMLAPMMRAITPEGLELAMSSLLPPEDRVVLTSEFAQDIATSFHDALRVGVDGWLDDDLAFDMPWGFSLDEISIPTSIWQGSADLMVPFAHGAWLSTALPQAKAHLVVGEGHFSIGVGALDQMLDELLMLSGAG